VTALQIAYAALEYFPAILVRPDGDDFGPAPETMLKHSDRQATQWWAKIGPLYGRVSYRF
jgi:hypothetical protein